MDLGGSTASDTDGMTFARSPDAVLTAVGDLRNSAQSPYAGERFLDRLWALKDFPNGCTCLIWVGCLGRKRLLACPHLARIGVLSCSCRS